MGGLVHLNGAVGLGHFHLMVFQKLAEAGNHLHIVLLEQVLHTLAHLLGHPAAALHHGFEVGLHFAFHLQAVLGGVRHVFEHLCGFQQGFGRNASPVEADAAQFGALHHGHFHIELTSADGCHIAARAASDNDKVEILHDIILV